MDALLQQIRPNALIGIGITRGRLEKKLELWQSKSPFSSSFQIRCKGEARPVGTNPPVTHLGCSDQGWLRGSREAIVLRHLQCPAAKLLDRLPWGRGTVPAVFLTPEKLLQPLLKEIELLELTTILYLMQPP